ncbi:hypothetical protein GH808_03405 [Acetobacterium fimetarium]|uniref:ABC-2 type transport system permease protein n=1 Tax=Acetobacterium fimetarium TaxID=52691 RepID=A0ABR6WS73_9FIRM|nr:hypothetical protein [Acetobacterium fimetarium]MBC3803481.1 hypothetical protein [Acetobacterium fimetarium]
MKEILSLTKLFINESWGLSQFLYNKANNKKEFYKQVFTLIIVPVALIPAFFMYVFFMIALYAGLRMINQVSVFLSISYIMTVALILFFGIMYVLSEFYFSKNIEELIPLPITSGKLIIAKFFSILIPEYVFAAFLFAPALIIYGVGEGMGVIYAILSLLVFLTVPVLPLAMLTVLIMLIMQSGSFNGRQDVLQIIFVFIGMALFIVAQIWFGNQMGPSENVDFQILMSSLLANNESLLNTIGYFVPTSLLMAWALNKITLMSFVWSAAIIGLTLLLFALMVAVGKQVYIKSIVRGKSQKKGKPLSGSERQKVLGKKSHKAMAVFTMDLRLLFRTPIYFFNNVSIVIIVPLCLLIMFPFLDLTPEDYESIRSFYRELPLLVNFALIGFFIFFGGTSAATASTFSREGKASWLTRMVPVSAADQIIGRTGVAVLIQSMGIVFTLVTARVYMPISIFSMMLTIVLGILGSLPILLFGLFMDMNRPLLDWDNPQKAVKNNMNVVITLFVGMAYAGVLIAVSGLLGYFVMPWLGYSFFSAISVIMTIVLYKTIDRNLETRLLNFE